MTKQTEGIQRLVRSCFVPSPLSTIAATLLLTIFFCTSSAVAQLGPAQTVSLSSVTSSSRIVGSAAFRSRYNAGPEDMVAVLEERTEGANLVAYIHILRRVGSSGLVEIGTGYLVGPAGTVAAPAGSTVGAPSGAFAAFSSFGQSTSEDLIFGSSMNGKGYIVLVKNTQSTAAPYFNFSNPLVYNYDLPTDASNSDATSRIPNVVNFVKTGNQIRPDKFMIGDGRGRVYTCNNTSTNTTLGVSGCTEQLNFRTIAKDVGIILDGRSKSQKTPRLVKGPALGTINVTITTPVAGKTCYLGVSNEDSTGYLYQQCSNGSKAAYDVGQQVNSVGLFDMNNDNYLDIVLSLAYDGTFWGGLKVILMNSSGNLDVAGQNAIVAGNDEFGNFLFPEDFRVMSYYLLDVDLDGKVDIVAPVASSAGPQLAIFSNLNTTTHQFRTRILPFGQWGDLPIALSTGLFRSAPASAIGAFNLAIGSETNGKVDVFNSKVLTDMMTSAPL